VFWHILARLQAFDVDLGGFEIELCCVLMHGYNLALNCAVF